jgi:hypothetical protein
MITQNMGTTAFSVKFRHIPIHDGISPANTRTTTTSCFVVFSDVGSTRLSCSEYSSYYCERLNILLRRTPTIANRWSFPKTSNARILWPEQRKTPIRQSRPSKGLLYSFGHTILKNRPYRLRAECYQLLPSRKFRHLYRYHDGTMVRHRIRFGVADSRIPNPEWRHNIWRDESHMWRLRTHTQQGLNPFTTIWGRN